jgi:hypothetical protein
LAVRCSKKRIPNGLAAAIFLTGGAAGRNRPMLHLFA